LPHIGYTHEFFKLINYECIRWLCCVIFY